MAQLRRNHISQGKGLQTTFRLVLFCIIAFLALTGGFFYYKKSLYSESNSSTNGLNFKHDGEERTYLPSSSGQVIHHKYYSLSYSEKNEQSEWTAYLVDNNMLNSRISKREHWFNPDNSVTTKSALHSDYINSGYTRGHLVPAADMSFDTAALRECFFMSNISPQTREFNNGIWKELEENVREWTNISDTLYIITGPIFKNPLTFIGHENKIAVPSAFFKVILDYNGKEKKGIGFIIPNKLSDIRLENYACSIDSVEHLTGLDFFNDLINDVHEEKLESAIDKNLWKTSEHKYLLRVNKWNFEK